MDDLRRLPGKCFISNLKFLILYLYEKIKIYFDFSQEDYAQQQREKEKERKTLGQQPRKDDPKKKAQQENTAMTSRMLQSVKTLERMVNQNIYDDISQGELFGKHFKGKRSESVELGYRLQVLGRPERRVQGRRGFPAAALEAHLREDEEARRHRSVLQQPLLRSIRRCLWLQ